MAERQPTERQLSALRAMQAHEATQQAVIKPADAEECEERGWAEAQPGGGYRLTEAGKQVLKTTDSN